MDVEVVINIVIDVKGKIEFEGIIMAYEFRKEDKDMHLYYVLKVHGCGCTIVFNTFIIVL